LRCVRDPRSLVLRAYGESIQFQAIMLWLTETNWEFAIPCPDRLLAGACGQTTDDVALKENSDNHERSDRRC